MVFGECLLDQRQGHCDQALWQKLTWLLCQDNNISLGDYTSRTNICADPRYTYSVYRLFPKHQVSVAFLPQIPFFCSIRYWRDQHPFIQFFLQTQTYIPDTTLLRCTERFLFLPGSVSSNPSSKKHLLHYLNKLTTFMVNLFISNFTWSSITSLQTPKYCSCPRSISISPSHVPFQSLVQSIEAVQPIQPPTLIVRRN